MSFFLCSEDGEVLLPRENTNIRIILRRIIRLSAFPFPFALVGWTKMEGRRASTSTVSGGGVGGEVLTCTMYNGRGCYWLSEREYLFSFTMPLFGWQALGSFSFSGILS